MENGGSHSGSDFSVKECISYIVEAQKNVKATPENYNNTDDLVKDFREAYHISEHNSVQDLEFPLRLKGIYCYDLMFCENPYDDILRQKFFTFFSDNNVKDVKDAKGVKERGEKIYSRYLAAHPEKHIDIMLQISYCRTEELETLGLKDRSRSKERIIEIIKQGICLSLKNNRNVPSDNYFYIKISEQTAKRIDSILKKLKNNNTIKTYYDGSVNLGSSSSQDKEAFFETEDAVIEIIEDEINKNLSDYKPKPKKEKEDENNKSQILSLIKSYLKGTYTNNKEHYKNFLRVCVVNALAVPGLQYLYFIPIPFLGARRIGHAAFSSKRKLTQKQVNKYKFISYLMMSPLVQANVALSSNRISYRKAIKSAKAAIMSRNMSHNLGSHVMSYLKHQMGSTAAIWNNAEVLKNLIAVSNDGQVSVNVIDDSLEGLKDIQMPYILGIGHFIGYLQERQDYIATIATDYVPYSAPVNMKEAVYDELNPDLRYLRHHKADENMNCAANILLNYIVKSEGFSRENLKIDDQGHIIENNQDIKLGFVYYNYNNEEKNTNKKKRKKDIEKNVFWGLDNEDKTNSGKENAAFTKLRKISFSLPGGLVGRQAIFSIMENIIRNAAKHGKTNGLQHLEFMFDVIDLGKIDNCLEIKKRICDDKWLELYKNAVDKDYLYLFTITDNLIYDTKGENSLKRFHEALVEDYIDIKNNMEMVQTNKGIKEIRISAAWMRNEPDEEKYYRYDDTPSDDAQAKKMAPLVAVELTKDKHLRYMICLQQERFAAVILDGFNQKLQDMFLLLKQQSHRDWEVFSNVADALEKLKLKSSYRFIIVANQRTYDKLRPYSSNRLRVLDNSILKEIDLYNQVNPKNSRKNKRQVDELEKRVKDYIQRCFYGITDSSEKIYIWDDETYSAHKNDDSTNQNVLLSISDEHRNEAIYAYRYHHNSEKQFLNFWEARMENDAYINLKFVEAISGDNSTDRIVRREPLNNAWYYSHLYAMKKNVAIIDERIFKTIHDVDETVFTITKDEINRLQKQIDRLDSCKSSEKDEFVDSIVSDMKKINITFSEEEKKDLAYNKKHKYYETISTTLKKILSDNLSKESQNYKTIVYQQKGVDVFTIVPNGEGFVIIGCVDIIVKVENNKPICVFDEVASIVPSDNNQGKKKCQIIFNDSFKSRFYKKYDYISIHQGILDKIYERFDIKNKEYVEEKKIVTNDLFIELSSHSIKNDYLPCFFIHSGRAKPSQADMPQKQPFIQYSALEYGVLDCKYALVELLDYAKYESE